MAERYTLPLPNEGSLMEPYEEVQSTKSTDRMSDCRLHDVVMANARAYPLKIAIQYDNGQFVTYHELVQRALSLPMTFMKANLRRASIIPLCFSKSIDLVVTMLALLMRGCSYAPVDPQLPAERK